MTNTPFIDQFKNARRVSTPLIAVRTPDPAATIAAIQQAVTNGKVPALVLWDIAAGIRGTNPNGETVVRQITQDPAMLTNPVEMLTKMVQLPEDGIIFMANAHMYLNEPSVVQAIWNLRDQFKQNYRTCVLTGPEFKLPAALANDVLILDEPLPDLAQLTVIVNDTYKAVNLPLPKENILTKATDAISGLAAFPAEQVCAMSIKKDGLDLEALWERKKQQIEQTPGLSVWRGGERFSDIGGCKNIKQFLGRVLEGEEQPRSIVFIDEIEKALAGASGDSSGTSQEMLGTLLTFMQDKNATGILFIGPPGAAKTAMAKSAGNEAGIPTIAFDMSSMKGSLVGESGANMRTALKVVEAVSQNRALFCATCNSIGALPPELRRRFSFGVFFFDLPTAEERQAIWDIYLKKYGLKNQIRPNDVDWTGAEIKQCCNLAWRLKSSLEDAATYIVPVAKSAAEQIENLRKQAVGRFISASHSGLYMGRVVNASGDGKRKVAVQ